MTDHPMCPVCHLPIVDDDRHTSEDGADVHGDCCTDCRPPANTLAEIDARLTALHDLTMLPTCSGVTRRATIRAITELIPALIADMHLLDNTTDPGEPIPQWMRRQVDLLRKGV